jgi:hypothetical protein
MTKIEDIIEQIEEAKELLKDRKKALEEELMKTEIYKAVFEATRSTSDENGYDCTEKEAHKHAISVTLKNVKNGN